MTDLETTLIMLLVIAAGIIIALLIAIWICRKESESQYDYWKKECLDARKRATITAEEPAKYWICDNLLDADYAVVGSSNVGKSDEVFTIIKTFSCPDDPEFAKVLAEELLDKLNER